MQTGFFWILAAMAGYGTIHSLLAANCTKRMVRRWTGERVYQRFYRLFFNLAAGVTLLPALALVLLSPDALIYRIRLPWLALSGALQLLAVAALLAGLLQTGVANFLGLEQLLGLKGEPSHGLVRGGLYRYVRHPLYAFSLALIWLTPVMTWNVLGFNIGATLYLTIGSFIEERKLLQEFGPQYAEYRRRTPMFLPGWGSWRRSSQ